MTRRCTALSPAQSLFAQTLGLALLGSALPLHAETVGDGADARELGGVVVEGQALERAASPKYTRPLRDTPQTISVVNKDSISGQNLLSLREVLSTLPGITFGAGEGGGGFGDSVNLRGFTASTDITVDGLRDSAQYSRSDTFNLERVEVINGANSVYAGAGSVGGSINLVSKVAGEGDFRRFSAGLGSDNYRRATADLNEQFNEGAALRLNAMAHRNDAPGREVEQFERWGVAPSLAFGLGTPTVVTLSLFHQYDDNTPQYGVPFYNGGPLAIVDPADYFGYRNVDRQKSDVDSFTGRIDHQFSEAFSLSNITKVSEVTQELTVNPPQGTYCLDNNLTPLGASCVVGGVTVPVGFYLPSGPRGTRRDTENQYLVNQTDFRAEFNTGAIGHSMVAGFSFSHEEFDLLNGNVQRAANGAVPTLPFIDIRNPDNFYAGPLNFIAAGRQAGELDNRALYLFDTLAFSPQWELNLGGRYERNEGSHRTDTIAITGATLGTVTPGPTFVNDDDLFSWRAGLVFKPVEAGSLYFAHGNSKTPSKASVNGACTAQTCAVDPETARSTELGVKWELYDGRLSLTGAVSRNARTNFKVADPGNPDNPSGEQQLDGEARVDALLLGASGLLTEQWAVYFNYTHLDSEVIRGVSRRQAELGLDYTRGDRLLQVPEDAFSVWTTYDLSSKWQFGYGATYQGRIWLTQHSATNLDGPLVTAPGYTVHRLAATYRFNRDLAFQLNLNNVTDKEFYTRVRNNGWATPGDARALTLTANYDF